MVKFKALKQYKYPLSGLQTGASGVKGFGMIAPGDSLSPTREIKGHRMPSSTVEKQRSLMPDIIGF